MHYQHFSYLDISYSFIESNLIFGNVRFVYNNLQLTALHRHTKLKVKIDQLFNWDTASKN